MFTLRRFIFAVITLPFVAVVYGFAYFGLALVANSYASLGLFLGNLWALGFAWVVAVTFSKQLFNLIEKIGA